MKARFLVGIAVFLSTIYVPPLRALNTMSGKRASVRIGKHGAVSPDGRSLVYVIPETGQGGRLSCSLWMRPVHKKGGPVRLTDDRGNDDFPCFTPDGRAVLFHSDRGGLNKIWMLSLAGHRLRQVTFGASQDFHPSVSPDGGKVAFDSNRSGNYDIWIQELESGKTRRATMSPAPDFSPSWSPQGKAIAFTSRRDGSFQIWMKRLDRPRSRARRLTSGTAANAHPSWSPTGKYLAYDSDEDKMVKIWVMELRRPFRRFRVTGDPWSEEAPGWFPGGDRLIFTLNRQTGSQLATAPLPPSPDPAGLSGPPPSGFASKAGEPIPDPEDEYILHSNDPMNPAPVKEKDVPPVRSAENRRGFGERVETDPATFLRVVQFYPRHHPMGIDPPKSFSVVLNHRLSSRCKLDQAIIVTDDRGEIVPVLCSYNPNLKRVDAVPCRPLERGRTFKVSLSGELSGEGGEIFGRAFSWSFRTKSESERKIVKIGPVVSVPFTVVDSSPSGRAVRADAVITCRFSKALDPAAVGADSIMLFDENGAKVPGEVLFPQGDDRLRLKPYTRLAPGHRYRVFVKPKLKSKQGEVIDRAHVWSFATAHASPLLVVDYSPKDFLGAEAEITVHFNRPVSADSMSTGKVFLKGRNQSFGGNTILSSDGLSLLFVPHRRLPNREHLTLVFPPGLADRQGNGLEEKKHIVFTTRFDEQAAASSVGNLLAKHMKGLTGQSKSMSSYLSSASGSRVKRNSWQYQGLLKLYRKGVLDRNLSADIKAGRPLTRYKSALLVQSAVKSMALLAPDEVDLVRRLAREFDGELHSLGVKLSGILVPRNNRLVGRS